MAVEYSSASLIGALSRLQIRGGIVRDVRVSLGGCCVAIGTDRQGAMRRSAHAHTSKRDEHRGWLCFKSAKPDVLTTANGLPTRLLAHEWAHAATWQGHTERWRTLMTKLGHASEAQRYAVRAARRVRWIVLDPPLHLTSPELAALNASAPEGFEVDHEYAPETINGRQMFGGGRYGYAVRYRYVPK